MEDFWCNVCKKGIEKRSKRYHCLDCFDHDLCENCYYLQICVDKHQNTHKLQLYAYSSGFPEDMLSVTVPALKQLSLPHPQTPPLYAKPSFAPPQPQQVPPYTYPVQSPQQFPFDVFSTLPPQQPVLPFERHMLSESICPRCESRPLRVGQDGVGRCQGLCKATYPPEIYDIGPDIPCIQKFLPGMMDACIGPYNFIRPTVRQQAALNYLHNNDATALSRDVITRDNKCPCCLGNLETVGNTGKKCTACGVFYRAQGESGSPYTVGRNETPLSHNTSNELSASVLRGDDEVQLLISNGVCVKCFSMLFNTNRGMLPMQKCVNCSAEYSQKDMQEKWTVEWRDENMMVIFGM